MKNIAIFSLLLSFAAGPVSAQFIGELVLKPAGCQKTDSCTLGQPFGFVDKDHVGWEAAAGDTTDGASIPRWAQIFVGEPFRPEYVPAAVLHDHYSKTVRPVRDWKETQQMFYQALRAAGVSDARASILYAGVLIGSDRWIEKLQGRPCKKTENCINASGYIITSSVLSEPESYGSQAFIDTFARMRSEIEAGNALGMAAVEALARTERPHDIYLHAPRGVIEVNTGPALPTE